MKQLQDELKYKTTLIDKLFEEKSALTERLDCNEKTLNDIKREFLSLKLNFARNSDKNNNMNLDSSDWFTVPGRASKQKPSVMLVGTSNIKNIEPFRLSSHLNTEKHFSYTVEEAKKVINESVSKPGAIAFHILTNELKPNSSTDCVSRLRELIQITKVKNTTSKIVISLATNRSDEQKLTLKVNTANSLIKELSLEEDCNFYISDNGNRGNNGLVRAKFVADDGYHLSCF